MKALVVGIMPREAEDLEKKRSELRKLEDLVARGELDLTHLQVKLREFEVSYVSTVGALYASLDELRAKIAEAKLRLNPNDPQAREEATRARGRAEQSSESARPYLGSRRRKFVASGELKRLYREVAKLIHPDLAADQDERLLREKVMAEANRAYEEGEEARLRALLVHWKDGPECVNGEGPAMDLRQVTRKIAQLQARLQEIEAEKRRLDHSELYRLMRKVEDSKKKGVDLLKQIAEEIEGQIRISTRYLEQIRSRL